MVELAGGKLSGIGAEVNQVLPSPTLEMDLSFPAKYVGVEYSKEEVVSSLEAIGSKVELVGEQVRATVPSWRPDLRQKTDSYP